jgi:chromosome segregation ATPase
MDDTLDYGKLKKQLEWLDNERNNDKTVIAALQNKLDNLDTENTALRTRLADMESEITRLNTLMARLEQFETEVSSLRTDSAKQNESLRESLRDQSMRTERHNQEIEGLNETLTSVQRRFQELEPIQDSLQKTKEEELRITRTIEELNTRLGEVEGVDENYRRSLKLVEENRRQDSKRLMDLQGEIAAIRQRQDETRGKQDLVSDNMRKLEGKIKNLLDAESERREAQTAFMEKINLGQIERERVFKEWGGRFEAMEKITASIETELTSLEDTHRAIKQSQSAFDEVSQRFERRIIEITEIQRLNEDRFRQEWTTFKSDDQKRWSNYILSQEEQHRDMNRSLEAMAARLDSLEEHLESLQDTIQQMGQDDVKRMMASLNALRDSIETYNTIFKD